jgi:hypothetical protein
VWIPELALDRALWLLIVSGEKWSCVAISRTVIRPSNIGHTRNSVDQIAELGRAEERPLMNCSVWGLQIFGRCNCDHGCGSRTRCSHV